MKKWFSLLCIVLSFALIFTGCSNGQQPVQEDENESAANNASENPEKSIKVALLLPGPVNDMGWNASAYEGLKKAEEDFNVEIAYSENVPQSDMEEVFRGYASQGFNIIIGHGFQFGDAAKKVAQEFAESKFVITSSDISQSPNLASVNLDNEQQGFVLGALAAMLTKTNVVGSVGGQEIPPIKGVLDGYANGVNHVNPDIKILSAMTGSFDDAGKAKETALAMIAQNADIVMAVANQAGLGSIEACEEKGILALGVNQDQNSIAPDTVAVSAIKSVPVLITFVVEKVLNDEFEPKFYNLGIKEKAIYLSSWHSFEDKISQEIKDKIQAISDEIASGEIKVK